MKSITIESITIKNFRSIRSIKINANSMNILVGLNDIGKSNILKALNLFFNNQTDYNNDFNFNTDFSYLFPAESHGTKEITISISFALPDTFKGCKKYIWEKKWRSIGLVSDKITDQNKKLPSKKSRIQNALRRIRFRYVPAVKSKEYFRSLLVELYSTISSSLDSPLQDSIKNFTDVLQKHTSSINDGVHEKLNISSNLTFPENLNSIFSDLIFITKSENDCKGINLNYRGDGIQARHIPIILKFIADEDQKSRNSGTTRITTIWGFEEPENGVELSKAFELAKEFTDYADNIQIFVTTHSPAFYMIKEHDNVSVFYVERNLDSATIVKNDADIKFLTKEMGLMPLVAPFIAEKEKEIKELKTLSLSNHIEKSLIVVEGITDKYYIEKAIELYSKPLHKLLEDGKIIVYTIPGEGGCSSVKRTMQSYIIGLNKGIKVAVLDNDSEGKKTVKEINACKNAYKSSENISTIILKPSQEICGLFDQEISLPYSIEHLLSYEIWDTIIAKKLYDKRDNEELYKLLSRKLNFDLSISEYLNNSKISKYEKALILYKPNTYSKTKIKKIVENTFDTNPNSDCLSKLEPTIKELEKRFAKIA